MKSFTLSALAVLPIIIPYVVGQSVSSSTVAPTTSSTPASWSIAKSSSTNNVVSLTSTYVLSTSTSSTVTAPQPSVKPVDGYAFAGCYIEPVTDVRALSVLAAASDTMTVEACAAICRGKYQYFGLEYGRECWCDSAISPGTVKTTQDQCNLPCAGDPTELCGSGNMLSLYSSIVNVPVPAKPAAPAKAGPYVSQGCYTEASDFQRALTGLELVDPNMTNELCAAACSAFAYFGTEYGDECWCGDSLGAGAVPASVNDCNSPCAGTPVQSCGGALRLNLFKIPGGVPLPPLSSSSSIVTLSSSSTSAKASSSAAVIVLTSSSTVKTSSSSAVVVISSSSSSTAVKTSSSAAIISLSSTAPKLSSSSSIRTSSSSTIATTSEKSSSSVKTTSSVTIASTSAKTTSSVKDSSTTLITSTTKSTLSTVASTSVKATGTWASVGCFADLKKPIMTKISLAATMNIKNCIAQISSAAVAKKPVKYMYMGLENGKTCLGATAAVTATSLTGPAACTVTCAGNKKLGTNDICGGKLQFNMYASMTVSGVPAVHALGPVAAPTPIQHVGNHHGHPRR